jgi:predicted DCC family thiol-disulfide oxidoreductase YuxK
MANSPQHLLFYDGRCGLCDRAVKFLLKADKKQQFVFAPLEGETASRYLQKLPPQLRFSDSLVLIENYQTANSRIFLFGKGALRIAWLLGWPWDLIGWLSFLPGFLFDWAYHLVAMYRHRFYPDGPCPFPTKKQKERFLP